MPRSDKGDCISVRGARVNNLKGVSLDIPRNRFVVITGVSGSGKSSLAFDTLFAEGQRRYAESISAFARQFLGRMSRPEVEQISGIPPAIAIAQKVSARNPRSTVASSTEIYDYLRLLFAKAGHTFSPVSGREVTCDTASSVASWIFSHPDGGHALLCSPVEWGTEATQRLLALKEEGFSRLCSPEGEIFRIEELLRDEGRKGRMEGLMVLVARLSTTENEENRSMALDSAETAFARGNGRLTAICDGVSAEFSNRFEADGILFEHPSEELFSYNNPVGACPECGGFGRVTGIDEDLVVPDATKSFYDDAVACWRGEQMRHFKDEVVMSAEYTGFPIHRPYCSLTQQEKDLLWNGCEHFTGITPFFKWVESQRYKIQYRYMLSRYSGKTVCRACGGSRLRKEALYVKVGGKTIKDLMQMPIGRLARFIDGLEEGLDSHDRAIASLPLQEIGRRLGYLEQVGLSYLTLDRPSNTLSGGESQRINIVHSLGSNLVGSMYILDEPSIGLHSRDTARLIEVLKQLRDMGNTVIVVEHDEQIIRAADLLIDIGPLAGKHGGEVVFTGSPSGELPSLPESLTLDYLARRRKVVPPRPPRTPSRSIEVVGAMQHNLKEIDVKFPLHCLTVVTGVSGSGKSSLVGEILYPAVYRHINQMGEKPGLHRGLRGDLNLISAVEYIDQNPIGKSSRSNPVTYLKVYDEIRRLFAEQPYAKANGYGHSHFSFNIDGGRCPECKGEGIVKVEMQFMADVSMVCPSCGGKRFKNDILEVRYDGRNISDILDMSVDEAISFFAGHDDNTARRIARQLQPLADVGLSYVSLGQSSSSLSGGESQRIKLASFLSQGVSEGKSILFIFDEPTTGLHFHDVNRLLAAFDALIERGHSIIVVEHNTDVIRAADHIIELGPGAGDEGGEVVFTGTVEGLLASDTPTGRFFSGKEC